MTPTVKIIYETDICLHFLYTVEEKLLKPSHTDFTGKKMTVC